MNILYLVRHAHPLVHPSTDPDAWPLSSNGLQSARAFRSAISWGHVGLIASSRSLKCRQTAELLARGTKLPVQTLAGLEELAAPWFDDPRTLHQEFAHYLLGHPSAGFESWDRAEHRFLQALREALRLAHPRQPVVVTHGRILTVGLRHFAPPPTIEDWSRLTFPDAVTIDWDSRSVLQWSLASMPRPSFGTYAGSRWSEKSATRKDGVRNDWSG